MFTKYSQIGIARSLYSIHPRLFAVERPYIVRLTDNINAEGEKELVAKISSRSGDPNLIAKLEEELKKDFLEVYKKEDELIVVQNKSSFLNKIGTAAQRVLSKIEDSNCDSDFPPRPL